MSALTDIFTGLAIFGDSLNLRKPELSAFVLGGHYDDILLKTFYWVRHNKIAVGDEYKTDVPALTMLKNAKDEIRADIQWLFRMAELEDQAARRKGLAALQAQLRNSNKPHEMGTVAEIAAQFGISKSEVRRRKAEGTLHELRV